MIKRYKFWRSLGYSIKKSLKVAICGKDFISFS
jgi:hypothetical protein